MPHTGDKCPTTGRWQGDDEHHTIEHMKAGDTFPPCSHCHRSVNYTFLG